MPRWARLRVGILVMSRPNSDIEPPSGVSSPVMRLNKVVLPAPFGPMISRRSPGATLRQTLVVTRRPAERLAELVDDERAHCLVTASEAAVFCRALDLSADRARRTAPGTSPSGMNTTMATKMAPSMKFQRVT